MRELTGVEERLVAAVEAGDALDLHRPGPVDTAEMPGWGPDRQIDADVLRQLLLGRLGDVDPRGLRLRGAVIRGVLDLDGIRSTVRLRLRQCFFPDGILVRGAALPLVDLGGSHVVALLGDDLALDGSALLWRGFTATGPVSLVGARIGGKLDLTGARLDGGTGPALVADRMALGGDLLLAGAEVRGGSPAAVRLAGCRVGGLLSCRGAHVVGAAGTAVAAPNLHVADTADFSEGFRGEGQGPDGAVLLTGARVSAALSFGGARLHNDSGPALRASYLVTEGTVYLDRLHARGGVWLAGSRIGGRLNAAGAVIQAGRERALDGTRLELGHDLTLRDAVLRGGDQHAGALQLPGARIGGDLDLRETRVGNEQWMAVRAGPVPPSPARWSTGWGWRWTRRYRWSTPAPGTAASSPPGPAPARRWWSPAGW